MKYTRTDITKVLTAAGIECDKAGEAAMLIVRSLADALASGTVIELRGLGTFGQRVRKAQARYNPRTKEPVHVPARRSVYFRPGRELNNALILDPGSFTQ